METIIKWEPISSTYGELYLENLSYGNGGLSILLKEKENTEKLLKIQFKLFMGFRTFAEFYRLRAVSENPMSNSPDSKWTFFVSEDDELIQWLKDENYNILSTERRFKNYVIWTPDDIIEVISEEEPLVEWVKI